VGLAPMVRTHWVTPTNFMRFLSIPRFRAYLGATLLLLGNPARINRGQD
jgi:hypothetical protein